MDKNKLVILLNNDNNKNRYTDFNIFDKDITFYELFKDKNFDLVQLHYIDLEHNNIIFCGQFKWIDNKITSIDHDSYNKNVQVYGYKYFNTSKYPNCVDILVGNNW